MKRLTQYIADETDGTSYSSLKYCFDGIDVPKIQYDDHQNISVKRFGEIERIPKSRNLKKKAEQVQKYSKPIFKYFLDGSRRVYKIDDIAYGNRVYPIVAGQIGVGCCIRDKKQLKKHSIENHLVLSLPRNACSTNRVDLFFNNLTKKINEQEYTKKRGIRISKCLFYDNRNLEAGEKYENLAIAKVQDEMIENEKKVVARLASNNFLNEDAYLLKDGSLEYKTLKGGSYSDLSIIKSNYKRVVGVSKSFNPEKCEDERGKSNANKIAELKLYHRTPAYMYESSYAKGAKGAVSFAIWYLRIRDAVYSSSPFEGIVKVEKVLVSEEEKEKGLDSEEVDLISANIINERLPVCYGSDLRWANHLYPIYLTESYIKSKYYSNKLFLNLF
ncbi:hypothetical protein KEM09_02555 [Carboxylicivirga mesophila]|uniref:NurA domain-containing protein n=1 Tax=Carboxylicivirga mesophila TaxID=1166478 RepID=A0ABS5K5K0_9BACT|nr:hypothetical protein [Carboxylicivirga mesophila]MBS2210260.1 hypothetical protein [Carboxylicivirga mesophila]